MRLSIARNDLARLLAATTRVVEARNTIPILSTVRLVAADGKLTATATDLDIEVTASCPVIDGDLAVCVDAKLLTSIVAKAGAELTLEADDTRVTIKSGSSKWTLDALPVSDFPEFKADGFAATFTANLDALIAPVKFAQSVEQTRFYLCGVYLQPGTATATDGHRLATNKASGEWVDHPAVIIPTKMVSLIPKGEAAVSVSENAIRFANDEAVITSRLIQGTYPPYERVIPSGNDKSIVVDGDALCSAVERVALVANVRGNSVRLSIANGEISLALRGDGEAQDSVPADYSGDQVDIGFSSKYVVDVFKAFPKGDVNLHLLDGMSPALLTSASAPGLRAVLMPQRG